MRPNDDPASAVRATLSRRLFLRRGALALGGLSLAATPLAACSPAPAPSAPAASKPPAAAPTTAPAEAKPAAQAAPTAAPAPAKPAAGPDRELIVAHQSALPTLDNHMHSSRDALIVGKLLFDDLLTRDLTTMKPVPHLATSWRNVDPRTWEIKLREGVKFHDGSPLTAADVKFSFERVLDPANKSAQRPNITWLEGVEVLDATTFRMKTKEPYPLLLERLTALSILPEKYVNEKGPQFVAENPVGSGPYKFVRWDRAANLLTIEASREYWDASKPSIRRMTFRAIPEKATQIAELISGGIHLARDIPTDQIPVVDGSGQAEIRSKPILRIVYLQFDGSGRAGDTPFQKLEVRRAANHAIDRKAIVDRVLSGQAESIDGPLNPLHFGYDPTITSPYDYNPDQARQLLAQAGYPNGFEVDFHIYQDIEVAEALIGYLARVGIKANVKDFRANQAALTDLRRAGKVKDMALWNWGSFSVFDADAMLFSWFHSSSDEAYNTRPELDTWLADARATLDEARRKDLYRQAQQLIVDQAFWVPLYARYTIEGVNKNLVYEPAADEYMYLAEASWKA